MKTQKDVDDMMAKADGIPLKDLEKVKTKYDMFRLSAVQIPNKRGLR